MSSKEINQVMNDRLAKLDPVACRDSEFELLQLIIAAKDAELAAANEQIDNLRCDLSDEQGANGCLKELNRNLSEQIERLRMESNLANYEAARDEIAVREQENAGLKARIADLEAAVKQETPHA